MPEPIGRAQRYMPGLDGARALAVAAVIGYHLGVSWLPGGLLGVGVFFTLSGYLITDLLLFAWESTGSLKLKSFWARRARRLLPALFVMLAVVTTWAAVAQPSRLGQLRGEVLAAALYVSNWWSALAHVSYFARFGPPSPLGHLWSLAIEEQFYLLWPWLLWLGLIWATHHRAARASKELRKKQRDLDLVAEQPVEEEVGLMPLELAFADAGAGEAGLKLLGPAPRARSRAFPGVAARRPLGVGERPLGVGEPREGTTEPDAPPGPGHRDASGLAGEGFAGADLLALGNLLSGRVARGTELPPRQPMAQRLRRPASRWQLWPLAIVTLVLAMASAVEMAVMYHPTFDPSRIYDGTDTRAFALLIGAALAMVWPSKGLQSHVSPGARRALDALGVVGLVVSGLLICLVGEYSAFLYQGGMVILSLAAAAVVASAAHPASRFGRALGVRPLRWLGVRSYGIYLWHYPIIVLTTPANAQGFDFWRAVLQVAATVALAELSWRFVESPVRKGALGRLWSELRLSPRRWAAWAASQRQRWVAVAGAPAAVLLAVLALAGALPGVAASSSSPGGIAVGPGAPGDHTTGHHGKGGTPAPKGNGNSTRNSSKKGNASSRASGAGKAPPKGAGAKDAGAKDAGASAGHRLGAGASGGQRTTSTSSTRPTTGRARARAKPSSGTSTGKATGKPAGQSTGEPTGESTGKSTGAKGHPTTGAGVKPGSAGASPLQLRTSCKQVVDIGDSTSASLVSSDYLPDPAQRLGAQYARVGIKQSIMRIVGGTSIVETLPGTQNAYQMAQALIRDGYHGCWVLALGTNDAADVFVGSNEGMPERVKEMMSLIGNQPVMWVNAVTLVSSGPYAETNMRHWDDTLSAACPRYPNMAVFNWAGVAQRSWFISDGIHYSSEGSAKRSAAIADALATAFPAGKPAGQRAGGCTVDASPRWDLPNFSY